MDMLRCTIVRFDSKCTEQHVYLHLRRSRRYAEHFRICRRRDRRRPGAGHRPAAPVPSAVARPGARSATDAEAKTEQGTAAAPPPDARRADAQPHAQQYGRRAQPRRRAARAGRARLTQHMQFSADSVTVRPSAPQQFSAITKRNYFVAAPSRAGFKELSTGLSPIQMRKIAL